MKELQKMYVKLEGILEGEQLTASEYLKVHKVCELLKNVLLETI